MNTSDKAKDKPRTALVARVADQIRQLVDGTEERLPDELEKVKYILLHSWRPLSDCIRLSAHGLAMRPPALQPDSPEKSPKRIHVAIQLPSGPGQQRVSAENSMLKWSPRYKRACQVERRSFWLSTPLPWVKCSQRFPRKKRSGASNWRMSGIRRNFPKRFSVGMRGAFTRCYFCHWHNV